MHFSRKYSYKVRIESILYVLFCLMHRLGIDIKLALMLIKRRHKYLSHFDTLDRFIGEGSGPQEFCYELLNHYIDRKLGYPTINPWGSSFNLINSGSISIVNKYLLPFSKTKNIKDGWCFC